MLRRNLSGWFLDILRTSNWIENRDTAWRAAQRISRNEPERRDPINREDRRKKDQRMTDKERLSALRKQFGIPEPKGEQPPVPEMSMKDRGKTWEQITQEVANILGTIELKMERDEEPTVDELRVLYEGKDPGNHVSREKLLKLRSENLYYDMATILGVEFSQIAVGNPLDISKSNKTIAYVGPIKPSPDLINKVADFPGLRFWPKYPGPEMPLSEVKTRLGIVEKSV